VADQRRSIWAVWTACGAAVLAAAFFLKMPAPHPSVTVTRALPPRGPFTVAALGDTMLVQRPGNAIAEPRVAAVRGLVSGATIAMTNLEENLLLAGDASRARDRADPRWPFGGDWVARELGDLGVDVVGLANNHATDYGAEGLADTMQVLRDNGLLAVGAGADLTSARAPVFVGSGSRRVAVIAVAASSAAESRATPPRGEIKGRPGLNPLRYNATITADAKTFASLRDSLPALQQPAGNDRELTLFGTSIRRGPRTSVELTVDARDQEEILAQIAAARANAELVVVSVHSHEPSNGSDEPAAFLQTFARAAVDAGAALIVGHGPHRLRGIEMYHGGAILYSLGDFLYQSAAVDSRAADAFDAGTDLYRLALGALGDTESGARGPMGDAASTESVVAIVACDGGRLTSIRLHPIELGSVAGRSPLAGLPQLADDSQSAAILARLGRLSSGYGTVLSRDGRTGTIAVP
jgi:poly-gamma-glutamate capsule biosynthesis protein CapA/YwtB (metallophosphatase superfamily)